MSDKVPDKKDEAQPGKDTGAQQDKSTGAGKKKKIYTVLGVIFAVAAVLAVAQFVRITYSKTAVTETMGVSATVTPAATATATAAPDATASPEPTETPEPEPTAYVCPVDLAAMQEINGDIYACIEIPNSDIAYPILQHASDDTYYLNHNSDGERSAAGALFTEGDYNSTTFDDPVTLIYGHSGGLLDGLQELYTDSEYFEANDTITIYTEEEELVYGVFAAVLHSDEHILYNYDFSSDSTFTSFFQSIFNTRSVGSLFREEYAPEPGDKVIILSTCYDNSSSRRFLVMAKLLA